MAMISAFAVLSAAMPRRRNFEKTGYWSRWEQFFSVYYILHISVYWKVIFDLEAKKTFRILLIFFV